MHSYDFLYTYYPVADHRSVVTNPVELHIHHPIRATYTYNMHQQFKRSNNHDNKHRVIMHDIDSRR